MYNFAQEIEQEFEDARNRTGQKKKVREIMAQYGETMQDIENNAPDNVYMEFILAGGRDMLEQVRIENMQQRLSSTTPQTPIPEAAKENPNYTVSNEPSMTEKEILDEQDRLKKIEDSQNQAISLAKQKLQMQKIMAEYGETVQDIKNNAPSNVYKDFLNAGGKKMLQQVLEENMRQRLNSSTPQTPIPLAAQKDPNYTVSNEPSMTEKQILDEQDRWKKREELFARAKKHLSSKEGEGLIDNIYLDTKGNITIGPGKMVDDKKTFMALDLKNGDKDATYEEKLAAYNTFLELKAKNEYGQKYDAGHYKRYNSLRISKQHINDLLNAHLLNDIAKLSKGIPEFDSLPLELQEVLVDIRYNSGAINEERWPKLRKAIREKNLSAIYQEINRKDIPKERNDWARAKIKSIKDWGYWKD